MARETDSFLLLDVPILSGPEEEWAAPHLRALAGLRSRQALSLSQLVPEASVARRWLCFSEGPS